jgi:predicted metal-dependent phosphoesterase TrpH
VDLHIHSCLSPCGDYAMSPRNVVASAAAAGLEAIGLCDHNSAENVPAFRSAGARLGMPVLGGMEICSREEAHIIAYFDEPWSLERMQEVVYAHLAGTNDSRVFGEQIVVDERGEPVEINERLLIGATRLSVEEIVRTARRLDGLVIAAHVDRPAYSLVGQLGFVPPGLDLDALEVSPLCRDETPYRAFGLPLVRFSDAHFLHEVGRAWTEIPVERAGAASIRRALGGR